MGRSTGLARKQPRHLVHHHQDVFARRQNVGAALSAQVVAREIYLRLRDTLVRLQSAEVPDAAAIDGYSLDNHLADGTNLEDAEDSILAQIELANMR